MWDYGSLSYIEYNWPEPVLFVLKLQLKSTRFGMIIYVVDFTFVFVATTIKIVIALSAITNL